MRHGVGDRLDPVDEVDRLEICEHGLARRVAVEAAIGRRHVLVQRAVLVQDVDQRKIVALADLEIVEVVAGRDLDGAGAFLGIGIFVGDDRDGTIDQRHDGVAADQVLVALVARMHRDGGVAQHRLGPRRRHRDEPAHLAFDGIFQVPEMALHLDAFDFEIADRGLELGIPVDEALVLVDQPLLVEFDEHFEDGAAEALVHREALARPVGGGAEAAQTAG